MAAGGFRCPPHSMASPTPGASSAWEGRSVLGVLNAIRAELGKVAGESLEVTVERDDRERKVDIPVELETALGSSTEARNAFEKLSYSHQREYVNHVSEPKKPETRLRRAGRTWEQLLGEDR